MTKRQTMTNIHKAQHRILKFERCEPHKRPRVIPGIPERLAVPLILMTHAVLLLSNTFLKMACSLHEIAKTNCLVGFEPQFVINITNSFSSK